MKRSYRNLDLIPRDEIIARLDRDEGHSGAIEQRKKLRKETPAQELSRLIAEQRRELPRRRRS